MVDGAEIGLFDGSFDGIAGELEDVVVDYIREEGREERWGGVGDVL